MARDQRLTIFDGPTSSTPIVAARPVGGTANVVITTAAGSDFPYLDYEATRPRWGVDIIAGSGSIAESKLVVMDKRLTAGDQDTGWFTKLIQQAGGTLLGHRMLWEEWAGGVWRLVLNATLTRCELGADLTSYELTIRDMRERARKMSLFAYSDTTTILPRGVVNGWGHPYDAAPGSVLIVPPSAPIPARFTSKVSLPDRYGFTTRRYGVFDFSDLFEAGLRRAGGGDLAPASLRITEGMAKLLAASSDEVGVALPSVEIWWRLVGDVDWTKVRHPRSWAGGTIVDTEPAAFDGPGAKPLFGDAVTALHVWPGDTDPDLPADGTAVEVMVVWVGEPSDEAPLHIEGEWGQVVSDILDGRYSARVDDGGTIVHEDPGIPYDAAAIAAVKTRVLARITEKVDLEDGRALLEHLEDFLFRPIMAAPGLNANGEVTVVSGELPPLTADLPTVDDTLVIGTDARWIQSDRSVISSVEWTYPRFHVLLEAEGRGASDRVGENLVTLKFNIKNSPVATKPHKVDARMFGAGTHSKLLYRPSLTFENGAQLANAYQAMAFDRFALGGEPVFARLRESAAGQWLPGQWVILGISWLTDSKTGERGMSRLAQLQRIERSEGGDVGCLFLDAGPAHAPPAAPTLGALSVDGSGVVSIPVTTIPAGAETTYARVQYAMAAAMPDSTSGLWQSLARISVPGTVRTPPIEGGLTVWVRARTEGAAMRSSAWTIPTSIAVPLRPLVSSVYASQNADGSVTVHWVAGGSAAGVRVYYGSHEFAEILDLTVAAYVDVAAGAGLVTLTDTGPGPIFEAVVEPWSAFAGGSVGGTRGASVPAFLLLDATAVQDGLVILGWGLIEETEDYHVVGGIPGDAVDTIWEYHKVVAQGDALPAGEEAFADVDPVVLSAVSPYQVTLAVPPPGYVRHFMAVPRGTALQSGEAVGWTVNPTQDRWDTINSIELKGVHEDGSVTVLVNGHTKALSYRYAFNVGTNPPEPTDGAVEGGTVRLLVATQDSFTLPAGTVPRGQRIVLRVFGYQNANGTGTNGVTDHSDGRVGSWERTKFVAPSLNIVTETETTGVGVFRVKLNDPDARATSIEYRTKAGAGDFSAWSLVSSSPTDGTEYERTVALQEDHPSFVEFRVNYTLGGPAANLELSSKAFDKGRIPDVLELTVRLDETTRTASALATGDFDLAAIKIIGQIGSEPSDAAVLASTAKTPSSGRNFSTADIGTLVSGLVTGQVVYVKAIGLGPNGEVASTFVTKHAEFRLIQPTLEPKTVGETTTVGTYGVVVHDAGGRAVALYVRKRTWSGGTPGAWGAFALKSSAPTDGLEYTETVDIIEDHPAQIQFRLDYAMLGQTDKVESDSPAFDSGKVPRIMSVQVVDMGNGNFSAAVEGDADALSLKVVEKLNGAPTLAEIRAGTLVNARSALPAVLGTLIGTATMTDTVHVGALGYSETAAGGVESPQAAYDQVPADPAKRGASNIVAITSHEWLPVVTSGGTRAAWHLLLQMTAGLQVVAGRFHVKLARLNVATGITANLTLDYNFNFDFSSGRSIAHVVRVGTNPASGPIPIDPATLLDFFYDDVTQDATVIVECVPYSAADGDVGVGIAGTGFVDYRPSNPNATGMVGVRALQAGASTAPLAGDRLTVGEGLQVQAGTDGRPEIRLRATIATTAPPSSPAPVDGELWLRY